MIKLLFIVAFSLITLLMTQEIDACTIFHLTDKFGEVLVGRNFDWETDEGRVWFIPASEEKNGIAIFEQVSIDMPFEGINDKGLFIGVAAVPNSATPFSLFKPIRKSLELVKIVLEEAQTVDEALKIFERYTIVFGTFLGYPIIHYKIVDKEGNSAIIEYVENEMKIIKGIDSQIMTNHYISNPEIEANSNSKTTFERYNAIKDNLMKQDASMTYVQELLKIVSQKHTRWSSVYNLNNQQIMVTYKNSTPRIFALRNELYRGKHGINLEDGKLLKYPEPKTVIVFRPHSGYGFIANGKGISHYGGRILLSTNNFQKYGLEVTAFDSKDKEFISIGIILEQRPFEWFNMSIGTVGYFNFGHKSDNAPGLTTNLGWEPDNHIPFKPFVTYRTDVIFSNSIDIVNSLSIGFNFEF